MSPEPELLSVVCHANAQRQLMQTAQWQAEWSPERLMAYRDRQIARMSKCTARKLKLA